MWCCKCKNDLSECVCPDLKERLEKLANSQHVYIAPEAKERYDEQAEKNKSESN